MSDTKGHGGSRNGAGRKSKADEAQLLDRLSPLEDEAFEALKKGITENSSWAFKMYFEYMYGKPKETIATTHTFTKPLQRMYVDYGDID